MKTLLELIESNPLLKSDKRHFKKGEILFHEDENCDAIYILEDGEVSISSYTLSGAEIVYNEVKPGEMFGNNLLFSSDNRFRGNVIGLKEGSIYIISKSKLIQALQSDQEFLELYLKTQSDFGKSLNAKLKILSFDKARERLEFFLSMHQGEIAFKSISELARSLFLKRETLSRLLSQMEEEGKITRLKHRIKMETGIQKPDENKEPE